MTKAETVRNAIRGFNTASANATRLRELAAKSLCGGDRAAAREYAYLWVRSLAVAAVYEDIIISYM